jgi:hypothetical protein
VPMTFPVEEELPTPIEELATGKEEPTVGFRRRAGVGLKRATRCGT